MELSKTAYPSNHREYNVNTKIMVISRCFTVKAVINEKFHWLLLQLIAFSFAIQRIEASSVEMSTGFCRVLIT